jgi:hypothetical protein
VSQALTRWRTDPDLVGLREQAELTRLSADERKDCLALWMEVNNVSRSAVVASPNLSGR